jgi:hypothetical protein
MRTWHLTQHDPLSLTLASDAQLSSPDYCNDHIWDLSLSGGEPAALAVQTTFGLRARMMRIFPRFTLNGVTLTDPGAFIQLPVLCQFYTNYARINFSPFAGIDVTHEIWVPDSDRLTGRMKITNSSVIPRQLRLEMVAILAPLNIGQEMHPVQVEDVRFLKGSSGNLSPVFYMESIPDLWTSPYPAYIINLDLLPGSEHELTWALCSRTEEAESFLGAKEIVSCAWEAEIARLDMQGANQLVEIQTGNPDWDAALAFSQKTAQQLLFGANLNLPFSSFVLSRQPDQGYSRRFDGSDYGHLWNGQSVFEAYYLSSLILPGGAPVIKGMLKNYLATMREDGFIDGKPGLGGQRSHFLAPPLLAALTWRWFKYDPDLDFLSEIAPRLFTYLDLWFDQDHDRDQDGFPEWDNILQTGFEENPLFDRWHPDGAANDISSIESPALGALLYEELNNLILIAKKLGLVDKIQVLEHRAAALQEAIEATWDSRPACYHYVDRDTHQSSAGETIGEYPAAEQIAVNKKLKKPQRLVIIISAHDESSRTGVNLLIHGTTLKGQTDESLPIRLTHWTGQKAIATSQNVFLLIDNIDTHGIPPGDILILKTPAITHEDITLLLPLWAHIPGKQRANNLVKKNILSDQRYWRPYGLIACPTRKSNPRQNLCPNIYIPWNQLIGEGLIHYGYQKEAADLVQRLLSAVILSLQKDHAFYKTYDGENGSPGGEKNVINGLAPVGLFLQTLGVQIISPTHVIINGSNPFPRPVTVKYRGLTVVRDEKTTCITFPDGQMTRVSGSGSHRVSLT